MNQIKDLLRDRVQLSEPERSLLVKLLWLLGQAPEQVRRPARQRVTRYLGCDQRDWAAFMCEVRDVIRELERTVAIPRACD